MAVLNKGGQDFVLTPRGPRLSVTRRAAIRDALIAGPSRGTATGISLVRVGKAMPAAHHAVAWLVSIRPFEAQYPPSDGPPVFNGQAQPRPHAEDYFTVAVSARTGAFIDASAGYDRSLSRG